MDNQQQFSNSNEDSDDDIQDEEMGASNPRRNQNEIDGKKDEEMIPSDDEEKMKYTRKHSIDSSQNLQQNLNFEEIFTCQICFVQYTDGSIEQRDRILEMGGNPILRKPYLIPCGHTFCGKCLTQLTSKKKPREQSKILKCPIDKSEHKIENSIEKDVPVNFSILMGLSAYNHEKKYGNVYRRYCQVSGHKSESINFYCKEHDLLMCQLCLIEGGHLQKKCQVESSQQRIGRQIIKTESHHYVNMLEEKLQDLKFSKMSQHESFMGESQNFEFVTKQIISLLESQSKQALQENKQNHEKRIGSLDNQISDCQQLLIDMKKVMEDIQSTKDDQNLESKNVEKGRAMLKYVMAEVESKPRNYGNRSKKQTDLENYSSSEDFFKQALYLPKNLSKYILLEQSNQLTDPNLLKLIDQLENKGINNPKVLEIFKIVDRKFFFNPEQRSSESDSINDIMISASGIIGSVNQYADMPRPIGWNTTISAPSMHGETLQNLYDKLLTARNVLDIGTGSGYVAACFAQIIPQNAQVYALDHIEQITEFAMKNIKKTCPYQFKMKKIIMVTQDGRKGLKKYQGQQMQFDVIHVGGQLNELEDEDADIENPRYKIHPISEMASAERGTLQRNTSRRSQAIAMSGGQPKRNIKIDHDLLDQLAPGGRMWIPLASKASDDSDIGTEIENGAGDSNQIILSRIQRRLREEINHHEVFIIDKDMNGKLFFQKLMDARYAQLRDVQEQMDSS